MQNKKQNQPQNEQFFIFHHFLEEPLKNPFTEMFSKTWNYQEGSLKIIYGQDNIYFGQKWRKEQKIYIENEKNKTLNT